MPSEPTPEGVGITLPLQREHRNRGAQNGGWGWGAGAGGLQTGSTSAAGFYSTLRLRPVAVGPQPMSSISIIRKRMRKLRKEAGGSGHRSGDGSGDRSGHTSLRLYFTYYVLSSAT